MGTRRIMPAGPSRFLSQSGGSCLLLPGREAARGIVLLHGAQETPETILQNIDLEALAEELGAALLLPSLGNSFGLDWGAGQAYRRFLLEELLPWAGESCPCFAGRERCIVGGISMGGYAALQLALSCPERFGRAFSISGALALPRAAQLCRICGVPLPALFGEAARLPENSLSGLLEALAKSARPKPTLCLVWGDGDWFRQENVDFAEKAAALGCCVRAEEGRGNHDWHYWRHALPDTLRTVVNGSCNFHEIVI
ncbi:MAG: hypothetical protein IJQ36_01635 [Oscillospiraceae bacterium]|nr:hypothetical protein [Oscillospiraceae bacterium]